MGLGLVINVYVAGDMHMGHMEVGSIVHNAIDNKAYVATQSGRFQCITPNIQNTPKTWKDWEQWHECSERFWSKNRSEKSIKNCDSCQHRFKCWTERKPKLPEIHFVDTELDFKQVELRMITVMNAMGKLGVTSKDMAEKMYEIHSLEQDKESHNEVS